jgi:sulfatase maturation enzyme AslB (radical SAM superfamily)
MISKCLDVYKNINIQIKNNSVAVSPCCLFPTEPADKIEFQNNTFLKDVRQQWDNNIVPKNCVGCDRHKNSNRWYDDNGYKDTSVELVRLDYWVGDVCNLKCAICGPENSSAWKEELKIPTELRKNTVNQVWKELDLTQLKYIHFNGGEPLLSKEHVEFLEALPNKSQIHINYNTNGTILPSDKLLSLWNEFKLVQLDFSIDDIEERFEYQRYPAKWSRVAENLQWYIDEAPVNCMFAINTTVSILNQDNLINLNQWLSKNFNANRVTDPIEYRTQDANGLFAVDNTNKKQIIDFLNSCDQRRGTDWKQTFPELIEKLS